MGEKVILSYFEYDNKGTSVNSSSIVVGRIINQLSQFLICCFLHFSSLDITKAVALDEQNRLSNAK